MDGWPAGDFGSGTHAVIICSLQNALVFLKVTVFAVAEAILPLNQSQLKNEVLTRDVGQYQQIVVDLVCDLFF
jgi:hypothetical protein